MLVHKSTHCASCLYHFYCKGVTEYKNYEGCGDVVRRKTEVCVECDILSSTRMPVKYGATEGYCWKYGTTKVIVIINKLNKYRLGSWCNDETDTHGNQRIETWYGLLHTWLPLQHLLSKILVKDNEKCSTKLPVLAYPNMDSWVIMYLLCAMQHQCYKHKWLAYPLNFGNVCAQ